ncbi:hypothetical protein BJX76DRAFT_362888, partial [Aspergillus varians]
QTYIPGLNLLSDLYKLWQDAQHLPETTDRTSALHGYLSQIEAIIHTFPPELRWRGGLARPSTATDGHDTQVANLFVTSLHIRSNLVQKFGTPVSKLDLHKRIVDDLVEVLYHLPDTAFNANGSMLIPKIRDIGAAYVEQIRLQDAAQGGGSALSYPEEEKVERILRRLDDLDCWKNVLFVAQPGEGGVLTA